MDDNRHNARRNVGLVLLACAFLSAAVYLARDGDVKPAGADPSVQDVRFAPLRQKLFDLHDKGLIPKTDDKFVIGYLTDIRKNKEQSSRLYTTNYFMTQYALAPFSVQDSADYEWVAGNFSRNKIDKSVLRNNNLIVVCEFEKGVYLLRRSAPAGREDGQ